MKNKESDIVEDLLGINKYANVIKDYLCSDNNPITMSIEGDWGCGKTTLLDLLDEQLNEKNVVIKFDAWQFSQFNDGKKLPILLIKKIMYDLSDKTSDWLEKAAEISKGVLSNIAKKYISDKTNGVIDAKDWVDIALDKNDVEIYEGLKEELRIIAESKLKLERKDKLIIMIDDLDRIEPIRAIEIMEIVNNFLCFENCKLILAIDYNVVVAGFNKKYGNFSNEDKADKFFEKIIQVPFKMPVYEYDINNYINKKYKNLLNENNINDCIFFIENSIGFNLRSIDRLFNALNLYKRINKEYDIRILLIILCIQFSYFEDLSEIKNFSFDEFKDYIKKFEDDSIKSIFFKKLGETIDEKIYESFISTVKKSDYFSNVKNTNDPKFDEFVSICDKYYNEYAKKVGTNSFQNDIKLKGHKYKKEYHIEYIKYNYNHPIGVTFRFIYRNESSCSFQLSIHQDYDKDYKRLFNDYNFNEKDYKKIKRDSSYSFQNENLVNYHNEDEMNDLIDIIYKEKDEILERLNREK